MTPGAACAVTGAVLFALAAVAAFLVSESRIYRRDERIARTAAVLLVLAAAFEIAAAWVSV